jgi:hypothetical protein
MSEYPNDGAEITRLDYLYLLVGAAGKRPARDFSRGGLHAEATIAPLQQWI